MYPHVAWPAHWWTYCQNFDSKIRRDHQKISYERRVYESVDDRSLSYAISLKPTKKWIHVTKGEIVTMFQLYILTKKTD